MFTPFSRVVAYRTYSLDRRTITLCADERSNLYRLKEWIDYLQPTLENFSGTQLISLLALFATMRDALNNVGATEAAGLRLLAYYLADDAMEVHEKNLSSATDDLELDLFGESTDCTWSHVIYSLLRRLLTDDILQVAYNNVTRAQQRPDEYEAAFVVHLRNGIRRCQQVFRKSDVINFYVPGLKTSVRLLVEQHVRMMQAKEG